ncbi:MAG TPA: glycine cleavage system protein GcvH [Spirochaetales bacterium]|nr:glycine cleavage system protein GcvH [Spirochaetales bacterium]
MTYDPKVKYQKSHEWARKEGNLFVVGISDYAQDSLGDVVFVELPEVGKTLQKGDVFGVVESVKAASDVYAPVSGTVVEVNSKLKEDPSLVNTDPFGRGWFVKIEASAPEEYEELLSAGEYEAFVKGL